MKKSILALTLIMMIFSDAPVSALSPVGDPNMAPFFRTFNPSTGDHFYTTSHNEAQDSAKYGYHSEDWMGYIHRSSKENTQPLFRLFNPILGDHFYTINENERNIALSQHGYQNEGVVGYVEKQRSLGTHPLLRLYNPTTHDHFYVMDYLGMGASEAQMAVAKYGYVMEGVMGYIHHSTDFDTNMVSYIVVFKDEVANVQETVDALQKKYEFSTTHVYTAALKGFSAFINTSHLEALRQEPQVKYIEEDQTTTLN